MPTPATHVQKPSSARLVQLDSFIPVPRGATAAAPPLLNWPTKDPGDTLDYGLDISAALTGNAGDTILTLDVSVSPNNPGDLSIVSDSVDGTTAIVWLTSGQPGTVYVVTVVIGTSSGRTIQRSVLLPVLYLSSPPIPPTAIETNAGVMITDQNGNPVLTG